MRKLKGIVAGVVSLCMLSTMVTGVSAYEDEFDSFFNQAWFPTIGESTQNQDLAQAVSDYKDVLNELEKAEQEINVIKEELDSQRHNTPEFDEVKQRLDDAIKNVETIKDRIEEAKREIERLKDEHHHISIGDSDFDDDIQIGDSDFNDDDDFTLDDSDDCKNNKHHHYEKLKKDKWQSYISSNVVFEKQGKFKVKENVELGEIVKNLMAEYDDTENYIADKTEDWFLKDKYQLTVKFNDEDGDFEIKFNPIYEDNNIISCYMYVVSDGDEIDDGYMITADEYATVKQLLNDGFLKDDIVARKNNIKDFDDFMKFIDDTYEKADDYFYDADGNGDVNPIDLLKNKKFVLQMEVEEGNYDCNNDGFNDIRDILQLKKRLLGIE